MYQSIFRAYPSRLDSRAGRRTWDHLHQRFERLAEVCRHDRGITPDLLGSATPDRATEVEDHDAVADVHDEPHVVLDQEDPDAPLVGQAPHQRGQLGAL